MTSGKMIRMLNKKLHHILDCIVQCCAFLSTWSWICLLANAYFFSLRFSLFTLYFVVYATRQLFLFSMFCACVFSIQCNATTTIHTYKCMPTKMFHSSQFTQMKRHVVADCCMMMMMVVRCCMSDFFSCFYFVFVCVWSSKRPTDWSNERANELLYTRASCTFYTQKMHLYVDKKKRTEDNDERKSNTHCYKCITNEKMKRTCESKYIYLLYKKKCATVVWWCVGNIESRLFDFVPFSFLLSRRTLSPPFNWIVDMLLIQLNKTYSALMVFIGFIRVFAHGRRIDMWEPDF